VSSAASVDETTVERHAGFGTPRCHASDHLGGVSRLPHGVPGIDPLGRKAQKEVLSDHESALLQLGQDDFLCGPGIGGRFQNHQLTPLQRPGDRLRGREDEGNVRIPGLGKGGRHADRDRVALRQTLHVGGGLQPARLSLLFDIAIGQVLDMGEPTVYSLRHPGLDIEAQDPDPAPGRFNGQRKSDIPQSDHTQGQVVFAEALSECSRHLGCLSSWSKVEYGK
jgi:hypothetical protein